MLKEILNQEKEARQFAQWITANSSQVISQEIEVDKKSLTVTGLLTDKLPFFLLEAVRILDQHWWISWYVFDDLKSQIKEDYQKLDTKAQKLFQLKLKNFKAEQAQDLANKLQS